MLRQIICLLLSLVALVHGTAEISIKSVESYTEIWTDKGSGAETDGSIWRPIDHQTGFYPLGDTVVNSHSQPTSTAVMVRELRGGALKEPESFRLIWNDRGSGATKHVSVYRMIPAPGYTCLGSVAMGSFRILPSTNKYRCVNNNYLTDGLYEHIWDDQGSGARRDVSLWKVYRDQANIHGIGANTFHASDSYNKPTLIPKVLDSTYTTNEELLPVPTGVIELYPAPVKALVWSDRGSGAYSDFSCWRPEKYASTYRMGDVPHNSFDQPQGGFIAKPMQAGIFTSPYSYDKIWTDAGSGAYSDGSFWRPQCPSGYRYISFACSSDHESPPLDAVTCVKAEHTVPGTWQRIWTDAGSGARDDVTVYMARTWDEAGIEVDGLGAVKNHNPLPSGYVLRASSVIVVNSKPVNNYEITSVVYDITNKSIVGSPLEDLKVTYIRNDSPDSLTITKTLAETVEENHAWTFPSSLETSSSLSITAGLPEVGETTVSFNTTVSTSFGTEDAQTTSKEISTTVEATVSPCYMVKVTLTGRRYITDVPFTAMMKVTYIDDTSANVQVNGMYRGVTVQEATANLGNPENIDSCTHAEK